MDFNSIDPLNTDPQPASLPTPADPTGFEHQLSELQDSPPPYAAWSPVPQGEAYSPYLEAEHPYSSHLSWDDDLHTPAAAPLGHYRPPAKVCCGPARSRRLLNRWRKPQISIRI